MTSTSPADPRPAAVRPRQCGVVLHPTALPGPCGSGSFGQEALDWIELLGRHGIGVWQVLPLAPPDGIGSPYSSPSGCALNPWFLDDRRLVEEGALTEEDLRDLPTSHRADLDRELLAERLPLLSERLLRRWPQQSSAHQRAFRAWCRRERSWLPDHCRFMVQRRLAGGAPWWQWPEALARHRGGALRRLAREQRSALMQEALVQWHVDRQWRALRHRASQLGVRLMGDLPFYVAHDSADVWSRRALFSVRADGSLSTQSGVPPDYFSETGQLWGTPVYRWPLHRLTGFRWWRRRLRRQLEMVDLLRLDHFRALAAYWAVPGEARTAMDGHWRPSPGGPLLRAMAGEGDPRSGGLPLVAEDLGVITPDVEQLRDRFHLPGMKILQFAFDGNPDNPYLPANIHGPDWVVYTGTHDNPTCLGWWAGLDERTRRQVEEVVGGPVHAPGWQLLELGLRSEASLVVVPLQDLLHLDDRARFNTPGTCEGNWGWRLGSDPAALEGALKGLGERSRLQGRH
jgi:4-alpha-glucanotransferase